MPFPLPKKTLLVLATAIVAIIVFVAVVLPLVPKASVLQTTIVVVDPQGIAHTIVATNQLSFVSSNGVQVSTVLITTSFTASSPNYNTYTVTPGAVPVGYASQGSSIGKITSAGTSWATLLTYNFGGGLVGVCGFTTFAQAVPASQTFAIGTTYYVGNQANSINTAGQPTAAVTSASILSWAGMNGCPGTGSFTLAYGVQVSIQAIGTGSVPSATYAALYSVGMSVSTGTIAIAGSTTGTTQ